MENTQTIHKKKKVYDKELMHILNKRMLDRELISEEVFLKAKAQIERL